MSAKMKNTILIVDNETDILDLTEKFLKLGDFDTITCNNIKEALRVIEERYNNITLILLDPMMPGLNKEKFLQSIKSDERYKHILVVFFSRKGLPEEDFPFPYIFKPPSPPGDLGLAGEPQTKETIIKQVQEYEPYCKYCGAELPKGQSICHVCGKKVM